MGLLRFRDSAKTGATQLAVDEIAHSTQRLATRSEQQLHYFVASIEGHMIWFFSISPKEATGSANLYSMIETAKANGLSLTSICQEYLLKLHSQQALNRPRRCCCGI